MQKIILYYSFVKIADPAALMLWQRSLCEQFNLRGRIILSEHGINGTLGGEVADLKGYIKQFKAYPAFKRTAFKWSDGSREDFPKLSVKVRPEIVTFGVPDEIQVNDDGIIGGGTRLRPQQVHELVEKRGADVVFFDGRNRHEAAIGKFKNAVVPDVDHTREFKDELESGKYDSLKEKPVVTYCTGGIRCEVLSLMMKNRGFKEVYQIDGGIVKYGETFGDQGLWEGSLFVFDSRMDIKFSEKARDIGSCTFCGKKTSHYDNCANVACNALILQCSDCHQLVYCSDCHQSVQTTA